MPIRSIDAAPARSARGAATPSVREPLGLELPGLRFTPAATGLWRVVAGDGTVLGHIERTAGGHGDRYASRRLLPGGTRSQPIGEFWSARDAAECFR